MIRLILVIVTILLVSVSGYPQSSDTVKCYVDNSTAPNSLGIPTSSPNSGEYLKILIIYVTFSDDNEIGSTDPVENVWPMATFGNPTRPINPYTLDGTFIDASEESSANPFMTRYREYTYSDFFCEMSRGTLDVIGDEVYFTLPDPSSHYKDNLNWRRGELNAFILDYVYNTLGVKYDQYDNWHRDLSNNWAWGGDGYPEMIIIQFRKIPDYYSGYYWNIGVGQVGGEATLGNIGTLTFGSSTIHGGCGITATQGINRATRVMLVPEHEMSHHIFGAYFNYTGFNYNHIPVGFMTDGHGGSTYSMLPMESSMPGLDWTTPTDVNSGNLQTSYTLGDFIETGECLKVAIPNTSPQEYFWVSNHQKVSVYDGVSRGGTDCVGINGYQQDPYCDKGKGLYIFAESDNSCANNVHGNCSSCQNFGDRHFGIDMISAEGKYTWQTDRNVFAPYNIGNIIIQKTIVGDRVSGISKFNKHYLQGPPSWNWSAQLVNDDICSEDPNDFLVTGDFHGNGMMAFNMGYDEIFSPYSNPATNSCQNPSSNSGLTFKLLSQNSTTGAITLKIYYNNHSAIADLPPAKVKNIKSEKDILLSGYHPKITWDSNLEPDFVTGGYYQIYRGVTYDCYLEPALYVPITTVANTETDFIDRDITLYEKNIGGENCGDLLATFHYKITAIDSDNNESVKSARAVVSGYMDECFPLLSRPGEGSNSIGNLPKKYEVVNYPNPFNPVTNIRYALPVKGFVTIKVYDVVGKMIKELVSEYKDAGIYSVSFDGANLSSGVYFYRIETQDFIDTKRMILMK